MKQLHVHRFLHLSIKTALYKLEERCKLMEPNVIREALSELENQYAVLLVENAPSAVLKSLWYLIKQHRAELERAGEAEAMKNNNHHLRVA